MSYKPVNTVLWLDIPVANLDRAISFYQSMLDLAARDQRPKTNAATFQLSTSGSGFTLFQVDKMPLSGGVLPYLNCHGRLQQALARIQLNGGKVEQDRHSMEPFGFRAVIIDSEGNRLALHSAE